MEGFDPLVLERGYRSRTHVFQDLMPRRVHRLLLVSSVYDSFILEEDGRMDEGLISGYVGMNLIQLPRVFRASTGTRALDVVEQEGGPDLVITTMHLGDMNAVELARRIKDLGRDIPVVLLTYDARELELLVQTHGTGAFERVVFWQGDHRILLVIVKLVEDRWNVASDTARVGVQSIIVIEDNVRYYSALLPILYSELMRHSQRVISESINLADRIMRMRARPKILLCHSYEQAEVYFETYRDDILGVISDIRFERGGIVDEKAGIAFAEHVRSVHPDIPILLHSSEERNERFAREINVAFVTKGSPLLLNRIRDFMVDQLSFGDFVFRMPDGEEVARADDLRSLEEALKVIPEESLLLHSRGNHFSNWLKARTEFYLARKLRPRKVEEYDTVDDVRQYLISMLREFRKEQRRGAVLDFEPSVLESREFFTRIGGGSLGGKGRGLAFANKLVETAGIREKLDGVSISVPPGAVIGTDFFDEFLEMNDLRDFAVSCEDDEETERRFLAARLPGKLRSALRHVEVRMGCPLAVRSSSLLEDSKHQPFAGIYRTIMLPNTGSLEARFDNLLTAVKLVYASTFSQRAKTYMMATSHRLEEEKMAVIIMRLVGARHGARFYPDISGVALSHNFYPVHPLRGEDGVAALALGLGTFVVDGGACLRYCPRYPKHVLQLSSVRDALEYSQRQFQALVLDGPASSKGDPGRSFLRTFDLAAAEDDGVLGPLGSTYSPENDAVFDGIGRPGVRLVSFAPILKHDVFPLSEILELLLSVGRWGMSTAVEIEFAVNLSVPRGDRKEFRVLQMRPMVPDQEWEEVSIEETASESMLCHSEQVLGNGVLRDIRDIVLVDLDRFQRARTRNVAEEIRLFNYELTVKRRPYLLVGVGRWGSADPWLGIPVTWDEICGARVIVESSFLDLKVTPSQGSHFFQNLTSMRVGYFTVDPDRGTGSVDWSWLMAQPVRRQRDFTRHVELERPLTVQMDGRSQRGAILKPSPAET